MTWSKVSVAKRQVNVRVIFTGFDEHTLPLFTPPGHVMIQV